MGRLIPGEMGDEEQSTLNKGAQVYYDGSSRYEGEWGTMLRHGRGVYTFVDGNGCANYEGNWVNGVIETRPEKLGKCTFDNGSVYEGECKGGKFHGRGKYSYFNGDCYDGQWQDNQRWGVGIYKQANGWTFDGTWYKNNKHGEGFYTPGPGTDGYLDEWKVGYLVSRTPITAEEIAQRQEEAVQAAAARKAAAAQAARDALTKQIGELEASKEGLDEKKQADEIAEINAKIEQLQTQLDAIAPPPEQDVDAETAE